MSQTTTELQSRVQAALVDDPRTGEHGGIEVLDNNGVIILKGSVASREISDAAEAVASEVDGVSGVINEIDVQLDREE